MLIKLAGIVWEELRVHGTTVRFRTYDQDGQMLVTVRVGQPDGEWLCMDSAVLALEKDRGRSPTRVEVSNRIEQMASSLLWRALRTEMMRAGYAEPMGQCRVTDDPPIKKLAPSS